VKVPVLQKEIELNDERKILVRQASGVEKIRLESKQAKVLRKFRHFGEPTSWSEEQQMEFSDALDEEGCGIADQIDAWLPNCILSEDVTINDLNTEELLRVLTFVRGDETIAPEGAPPLE
jgi:hypothetical protein